MIRSEFGPSASASNLPGSSAPGSSRHLPQDLVQGDGLSSGAYAQQFLATIGLS